MLDADLFLQLVAHLLINLGDIVLEVTALDNRFLELEVLPDASFVEVGESGHKSKWQILKPSHLLLNLFSCKYFLSTEKLPQDLREVVDGDLEVVVLQAQLLVALLGLPKQFVELVCFADGLLGLVHCVSQVGLYELVLLVQPVAVFL